MRKEWIDRVIDWFCNERMTESILGDLQELYDYDLQHYSSQKAKWNYFFNAIGFLKPFAWKKQSPYQNRTIMWRNNFKLAFRHLLKNQTSSFINIFGLTVGIIAYLTIIQYISFELSYEDFNEYKDRIYRVALNEYTNEEEDGRGAYNYYGMAEAIQAEIPEVENFVTLHHGDGVMTYKENRYLEEKILHVDSTFFQIFSFPLVAGDLQTALNQPNTVVLSKEVANKYFPTENPVGKTIRLNKKTDLLITGLVEVPQNSHIEFDFLINNKNFVDRRYRQHNSLWDWSNFLVYIKLSPNTDPAKVEAKFPAIIDKYMEEDSGYTTEAFLQALPDIHLYSDFGAQTRKARIVYALLIIALFVLIIAWVNYINLSIAQATERAKEVVIRKIVGAGRRQLIGQFLAQSILINGIALGLAILISELARPIITGIIGNTSNVIFGGQTGLLLLFIGFFVLGILISGFYPALVLSAFKPVTVLKGKITNTISGNFARKGLTVFQFIASILLIAGTFALYKQIQFMQDQDLGFNPAQTLVLNGPRFGDSTYTSKLNAFKEELIKHPSIEKFTASSSIPGKGFSANLGGIRRQGVPEKDGLLMDFFWADEAFIDAYELPLIVGQNFNSNPQLNRQHILINESAVRKFGFKSSEDAQEKTILVGREDVEENRYKIVGIVKDYHHQSLKELKEPIVIVYHGVANSFYSLKVKTSQLPQTISFVQDHFQRFFAGNAFDYFFLDEVFNAQYQSDQRLSKILAIFSLVAIFIACLGLFGLVSFTAIKKTKEIGIRKILGATISHIAFIFSKEFLGLILIANVIALPIAWYLIKQWLENYAYAIPISWLFFAVPALLILLIALLTISFHTLKAALINPVNHLRYE